MEFRGKRSTENLPWKFHERFSTEFHGISTEDFQWKVFHEIPWSINLESLFCRIARYSIIKKICDVKFHTSLYGLYETIMISFIHHKW